MSLKEIDTTSVPDTENWTAYTPPSSIAATSKECSAFEPPWPGSTYIIRSVSTGKVVAFRKGQIVLSKGDGNAGICWECVDDNGWLGFRDPASYRLLGYGENHEIRCEATEHKIWEHFCVRQKPGGGYLLMMTEYDDWKNAAWQGLRPLGIKIDDGLEKLVKVTGWEDKSAVWEFIKV
ncbi:hypothetical protein P153DRAFT_387316 [Dothidotthia symphoricarpi CBS 119687]|uniref:Uncharacterized protein n=1 Tax=Dothidotthia symphoricarpi CBS 119687 TaxID=1392245 RepID=A0A6A6A904_9PLEO|nr:uncharacterized protein P153DRAFT_387316 [Dothidotthia symphoricarpi CBS 119687]KAF2127574.1 hypothetical protein P153DRAFT_387316 [Dothidotthia symphoricarpi CBS 119687]